MQFVNNSIDILPRSEPNGNLNYDSKVEVEQRVPEDVVRVCDNYLPTVSSR